MAIASVNPATGETFARFDALTRQEIEEKLQRAARAFVINRARAFPERAARMSRCAGLLEERAPEYGRLITMEMGKPVQASIAEVQKCALVCRYYAEHA
ncbi:MAG TPA: aldehyde dehydrogenase family protein, partial [Thermoanaerobaculia bacterium]|nr:aldehyde dehydrogenase family protein [Thermoanaerobaculia bacterium]